MTRMSYVQAGHGKEEGELLWILRAGCHDRAEQGGHQHHAQLAGATGAQIEAVLYLDFFRQLFPLTAVLLCIDGISAKGSSSSYAVSFSASSSSSKSSLSSSWSRCV